MKTIFPLLAGFALAAGTFVDAPAFAQSAADAVTVKIVSTADLDLQSTWGRKLLDQRLVTAAHEVCDVASAADLQALNQESRCRDDVLSQARERARAIASRNSGEAIRLAFGD